MAKPKFTTQQVAFVDSYMVHFNATRAATEAKYSTPSKYGWALLNLPHIIDEIKKRSEAYASAKVYLKERVVEELCAIAFSSLEDVGRFGPSGLDLKQPEDIPDTAKRAIAEYTVNETDKSVNAKVRLHSKTQALDLLGKHLGMFKDAEIQVNVTPYIIKRRNGDEVELGVKNE
tara:strand:+ start:1127 stop:1648 length:522 start_codon:yes stop_codon:yes gene_type:complete